MKLMKVMILLNLLFLSSVQAVVYTDKAIDLSKLSFEELQSREVVCTTVAAKIKKIMRRKFGVNIEVSEIISNSSDLEVTLTHKQVVNIFEKKGMLIGTPGKLGLKYSAFLWNCNLQAYEDYASIEVYVDSTRGLFSHIKGDGDTKATALTLK